VTADAFANTIDGVTHVRDAFGVKLHVWHVAIHVAPNGAFPSTRVRE
jgi:hypothetical protein